MEKISWLDKVINEGVIGLMNEDKQILNSVSKRNINGLAIHDLANNDGCVALKRAAEVRGGWRTQRMDVKTAI